MRWSQNSDSNHIDIILLSYYYGHLISGFERAKTVSVLHSFLFLVLNNLVGIQCICLS